MSVRKLSELPQSKPRDLLMDAERRGVKTLGPELTGKLDWTAIVLMGLAEIILELKERNDS